MKDSKEKSQNSFIEFNPEEDYYAIRCTVCLKTVEDYSLTGERCKGHV